MPPQRRNYTESSKAQVIREFAEPGAFIANIALGYSKLTCMENGGGVA